MTWRPLSIRYLNFVPETARSMRPCSSAQNYSDDWSLVKLSTKGSSG